MLTAGGWFSDFIKKFIGTIITVALCFIAPWGSGFWSTLSYAAIGSAVSTVVNGRTFASFAIGAGIGIAAGYIAGAFGDSIKGFAEGFGALKDVIGYTLQGALQGSIAGAISSAVYGQNIWKGMGEGALGGAIGVGVALGTEAAIAFGRSVLEELLSPELEKIFGKGDKAYLTIKLSDDPAEKYHYYTLHSIKDFEDVLNQIKVSGKKITFFEYVGHGYGAGYVFTGDFPFIEWLDERGLGLMFGEGGLTKYVTDRNIGFLGLKDIKDLVREVFAPNAVERANRRHRKMQKSIYRVRTKDYISQRIAIDMQRDVHINDMKKTINTLHCSRSSERRKAG